MEKNNGVAVANGQSNPQKSITDSVLARITQFQASGELRMPKDYSAENALKSAYLVLVDMKDRDNKPVLESCTKESIANSLLKMVTEGLSVAKRQGSFIPYAGKLTWQREYAGSIALARRFGKLKSIKANPVFENDVFEFQVDAETGRRKLLKHEQALENVGGKIKGAYAIIELEDGTKDMEVMTWSQIQAAWGQGHAKGGSPAHKNFPDQMAAKTVINRACKILINSSDDSHLDDSDLADTPPVVEDVQHTIVANANKKVMSMEDETSENSNTELVSETDTQGEANPI